MDIVRQVNFALLTVSEAISEFPTDSEIVERFADTIRLIEVHKTHLKKELHVGFILNARCLKEEEVRYGRLKNSWIPDDPPAYLAARTPYDADGVPRGVDNLAHQNQTLRFYVEWPWDYGSFKPDAGQDIHYED